MHTHCGTYDYICGEGDSSVNMKLNFVIKDMYTNYMVNKISTNVSQSSSLFLQILFILWKWNLSHHIKLVVLEVT